MLDNLKIETLEILSKHNKTENDVKFVIINNDKYCTFEEYLVIADKIDYDSSFGIEKISNQLYVVGDNWWLSRDSYDGSEWWDFNIKPLKPENKIEILTKEDLLFF